MILEEVDHLPSPRAALRAFMDRPHPFLLDSSARDSRFGRFSFAGADPFLVVSARGRRIEVRRADGVEVCEGDPFEAVRELVEEFRVPAGDLPTPLPCGAVGFLSYDLGRSVERLPELAEDDLGMPDLWLGFYGTVATWDHERDRAFVASLADRSHVDDLCDRLRAAPEEGDPPPAPAAGVTSNFTREEYVEAVARSKELIAAGDVIQVNLSQRFTATTPAPGWDTYRRLAETNPASFSAYLAGPGDVEVLSSSPERFLRVSGDRVTACPIKGTRPRAEDPERDRELARELLASEKDRAELAMIVDLLRSDLGRVSRIGSVKVEEWPALTSHAGVHHLHGTVTSRIAEDRDLFDLLRSAFPCGSVTGAPKVRAMEIIEGFEPYRRGVYCGSIGYFSFTGEADLNVAIRTLVRQEGRISFSVGGGIVADSDPEAEYEETLDKGRRMAAALGATL